ncbi:hypothetical protein H4CHR_04249 [Variovorax sp. PBS-H4]|nr:hypothetical protein H4CHR_04249 [Variovorax sp. PBS-H4]
MLTSQEQVQVQVQKDSTRQHILEIAHELKITWFKLC